MVKTKEEGEEGLAGSHSYNLRKRKEIVSQMKRSSPSQGGPSSSNQSRRRVVPIGEGVTLIKYEKGIRPDDFLKILLKSNLSGTLDLKDMTRAPNEKVKNAIFEKIASTFFLRITVTGPVHQEYSLDLLKKSAPYLKVLEIVLPKYATVKFQREFMNQILEMELVSLIMFGSFKTVQQVQPPKKKATLKKLKCPGETQGKNNFLRTLLKANADTLMMIDFGEDPFPQTISLASECSNLLFLIVNNFGELRYLQALPNSVQVLVRGSEKEPVDVAVSTILSYGQDSLLARAQFLGIYANPLERERMHLVLMAVAEVCQDLKALKLIGWTGRCHLLGVIRSMPWISRLSLQQCRELDVQMLDEIETGECLPELRGLVLCNCTFNADMDTVMLKLANIHAAKPRMRVHVLDNDSESPMM